MELIAKKIWLTRCKEVQGGTRRGKEGHNKRMEAFMSCHDLTVTVTGAHLQHASYFGEIFFSAPEMLQFRVTQVLKKYRDGSIVCGPLFSFSCCTWWLNQTHFCTNYWKVKSMRALCQRCWKKADPRMRYVKDAWTEDKVNVRHEIGLCELCWLHIWCNKYLMRAKGWHIVG